MINTENAELLETPAGSMNDVQDVLDVLGDLSSTSTSDSEESELDWDEHPKCKRFVQTIDAFNNQDFKCHMRLQRQTMEYLISRYSQSEYADYRGGRERIDSRKSVYMYIWYISNTVTFRQLGNLFGVSKSTAWIAVRRVTSFFIVIGHEYVKWPQGAAADEAQAKFCAKKRIPSVIGAIDCTHIDIKAPKTNKECYFDRKQSYSLVLQAVVDADKRFINITCGEPGSLHDYRVLRRSDLYTRAESNYEDMFPNGSFILGDSAYPPSSWLVPPFKDFGNLTDSQRNFNKLHSGTRIVVENAFALLKGRFRRLLRFTEQNDLGAITNLIVSACVVHNICICHDDLYSVAASDHVSDTSDENSEAELEADFLNRRDTLFNYLLERNII